MPTPNFSSDESRREQRTRHRSNGAESSFAMPTAARSAKSSLAAAALNELQQSTMSAELANLKVRIRALNATNRNLRMRITELESKVEVTKAAILGPK